MSKTQHSPLPWKLAKMTGESTVIYYTRPDGSEPGVCSTNNDEISTRGCLRGEAEAIAELIVRAVNAHEALVRSAQMVVDWFESRVPNFPENRLAMAEAARAALALAKGEK